MSLSCSWQFIGGVSSLWYRLYDRLRRGVNRRLVAFLNRHLPSSPKDIQPEHAENGIRVLEAGCGTAFASSLFAERKDVRASVCMDIDPTALAQAKQRDPALPAVVGDLTRMPFTDGAFDLVYNSSTVEHLEDPLHAVCEMGRVCRDDGSVFVGVPFIWGPLGFQPLIRNTIVGKWLGKVFTRASLDRMLRAAGLAPIDHLRYFWNFFVGAVATKPADPQRGANTC